MTTTQAIAHPGVRSRRPSVPVLEEPRLLALIAGLSRSGCGREFFEALVRELTACLGVEYAFVAEVVEARPLRARAIAVFADGTRVEPLEYEIEGTPCRELLQRPFCCYPTGARQCFPADRLFEDWEVESYAGIRFLDRKGHLLGWMGAMSRRPLADAAFVRAAMELVADRACSELRRGCAERTLLEEKTALEGLMMAGMRDSPASHERQRIGPEENGRIERRREIEASRDPLTGLANREFFLRRVQGVIGANDGRCPQELAVLVIGLDRFKVVNGSLGHRSGDDFLRLLAGRIAGCSRPGDLVARLGGDEFAILLDAAAGRFDAPGVGSRILEELSAPIQLAGRTLYPAASIGIAFGSSSRGSAAELIRDAGTALHRAKEAGRDRVAIFDRSMHRAAVERLEVESDLRRAIDRDELWLAYQPIVSVAGGRVEALEVL